MSYTRHTPQGGDDLRKLNIDEQLKITTSNGTNNFEELIQISNQRRINASMLALSIKSDRNISAMCRTAEIFGMRDFITFGDHHVDMRAALGSHNYLNFIKWKCDVEDNNDVDHQFDNCMRQFDMISIFSLKKN